MVQTGRWLLLSANTQESRNCPEAPLCNRSWLESLSIQISWIHFVGARQMLQSYILKSKSTSTMPTSPLLCVKSTILLNRQKKQTILYIIIIDGLTSEGPAFNNSSHRAAAEFWHLALHCSQLRPVTSGETQWEERAVVSLGMYPTLACCILYTKVRCKNKKHSYFGLLGFFP